MCLIQSKADVNQVASESRITAAHHVAAIGDVVMMELLVKQGAKFDFSPTEKGSVLHWATTSGMIDPVAYLLVFNFSSVSNLLHADVMPEHFSNRTSMEPR